MPTEGYDVILRLGKVLEITGLSKTTIYYKIKDGTFPKQIKIGYRSVGWKFSDVQDWINACTEGRAYTQTIAEEAE